jgi:hypothetical protein
MTQQRAIKTSDRVGIKPHIRKIFGYWRVSAVPVKWNRLSPEVQRRFKKAHDFIDRLNSRKP